MDPYENAIRRLLENVTDKQQKTSLRNSKSDPPLLFDTMIYIKNGEHARILEYGRSLFKRHAMLAQVGFRF